MEHPTTPTAEYANLLAKLQALGPFSGVAAAERALSATLQALATLLTWDERHRVGKELPAELRHAMPAVGTDRPAREADFVHSVAANENVSPALAKEHAEIVCRALASVLSPSTLAWLERHLPAVGRLFEAPEALAGLTPAEGPSTQHDLAEGHDGGHHPLSSASPEHLAHRHSVARSTDPHADTKLSSARGLTQERDDWTLAAGEPGSRRPVSRTH